MLSARFKYRSANASNQAVCGCSKLVSTPSELPRYIPTWPPFGLVRKKAYGNADANEYLDWFRPFAQQFHRVLKESGSLVIDIGGAWVPGQPTFPKMAFIRF